MIRLLIFRKYRYIDIDIVNVDVDIYLTLKYIMLF